MAYVTCAISGVLFECSHFKNLRLPANIGYPHPIFAADRRFLRSLYVQHTKGLLSSTDSYLLFLAYLHSSGKIDWQHPATCNPSDDSTVQLIENNLRQLLSILERTEVIRHPKFKQPSFKVTYDNAALKQVPNWIKAWDSNINNFYTYTSNQEDKDALQKVENKLTSLILSGNDPKTYAATVSDWAARAAGFPTDKAESYKKLIRSCFNTTVMFNTPLAEIKEVKAFCEENIEAGSIHFHTLMSVLSKGLHLHVDYLGGSSLALGYNILDLPSLDNTISGNTISATSAATMQEAREKIKEASVKADKQRATIIASAPDAEPNKDDYESLGDFLKAKLAYRVARAASREAAKVNEQLGML